MKKDINRRKIPKNQNPIKIVNIAQKILNFNKQQKGKGLSSDTTRIARVAKVSGHSNLNILTPRQMLQRLPITALAQVKAGNASENLLNEIRQIVCYLYRAK